MQYLSDKIVLRYSIPGGTAYADYSIYVRGARDYYGNDPIFTGRVYRVDSEQSLYLNDIVKNYMYNDSAFKPDYNGRPFSQDYNLDRMVCKFKIEFDYGDTGETDWILPYYKDANLPDGYMKANTFNPENGSTPLLVNPLAERTSLLPRVPQLFTSDSKFWFFAEVIPTSAAWNDSEESGDPVFVVHSDNALITDGVYDSYNKMWGVKLYRGSIYDYTQGSAIYFKQYSDSNNPISYTPLQIKVADVDECPAPFYLIWMDRTGAYQCQPFTKRIDYSESIATTNVTNMLGEERPYEKNVTSQWTLHTDWMDDDSHKAYESVLTSPWIYLYDTENDQGWYVNCTDSNWTDRKYKNQKRMFYLTINLKSIGTQEMIY